MNFWSIASFSNLYGPMAVVKKRKKNSVSCQVKQDRAVGVLPPSPSEHWSLIYRCQKSSEEERSTVLHHMQHHCWGVLETLCAPHLQPCLKAVLYRTVRSSQRFSLVEGGQ